MNLKKRSASPFVFVNGLGGAWTGNAVRLQVARIKKRKLIAPGGQHVLADCRTIC